VRAGLARARWPGRLERIEHAGITVLLDGAHNPHGAAALARALDDLAAYLPERPATLLLGVLADKDADAMLAALGNARVVPGARIVMTRVPDTERSLPATDLASIWQLQSGRSAAAAIDDVDAALERALALAVDAGGLLLVAGSLYLVGHVRALLLPESAAAAA
jgi:dihydrofolate synthase/folylpolyglutamate synthase